jgi:hypothetical protein
MLSVCLRTLGVDHRYGSTIPRILGGFLLTCTKEKERTSDLFQGYDCIAKRWFKITIGAFLPETTAKYCGSSKANLGLLISQVSLTTV